ncbi:MAG: aminotransferase class I/II-fold pyridoxal phosphate-dependent enzyme [Bacteroidetes bacterium]|nr:aminotransferase class I/II-fold pyridoxal phosphate-dependent enzyme [Bacteroidota bacterium]
MKSKLPDIGTTIFTVMSKMADEAGALNLSQGFPDFEVSRELIAHVSKAMKQGHNQYAPMPGLPFLCKSIANSLIDTYNWDGNKDAEITVTGGATEALYSCITAFIHPGDEVLIFEPAYDSYIPAVRLSGGVPVPVQLNPENFSVQWDKMDEAISEKTKMIIINTPHNPTGSVWSKADMVKLEQVAIERNLLVLADEVYDRIIFDGLQHESVLRFPELRKRSMAVFSFGKTFHVTGWKVGYVVAPDYLTREIRKVHQFLNFSVNTPIQFGLATYLADKKHYQNLHVFYEKKRDLFLKRIAGSRFKPVKCSGTYFQLLSYAAISEKDERTMAEYLTKEYKIASIPVSPFYSDQRNNSILRFCFAKKDETIKKAAKILCRI